MFSDELKAAAKQAHGRAMNYHHQGSLPIHLGVDGMLALMHEAIRVYSDDPQPEHLVDLAARGLVVLHISRENAEFEELESSIVPDDGEPDDSDFGDVVYASPSGEVGGPPDEEDDGSGRWSKSTASGNLAPLSDSERKEPDEVQDEDSEESDES